MHTIVFSSFSFLSPTPRILKWAWQVRPNLKHSNFTATTHVNICCPASGCLLMQFPYSFWVRCQLCSTGRSSERLEHGEPECFDHRCYKSHSTTVKVFFSVRYGLLAPGDCCCNPIEMKCATKSKRLEILGKTWNSTNDFCELKLMGKLPYFVPGSLIISLRSENVPSTSQDINGIGSMLKEFSVSLAGPAKIKWQTQRMCSQWEASAFFLAFFYNPLELFPCSQKVSQKIAKGSLGAALKISGLQKLLFCDSVHLAS